MHLQPLLHCGKAKANEARHPHPPNQDWEERVLPTPCPWDGASLLVGVFFALLNEGNGFRSKAVGHFICSQGDPENILMVPVVILGNRNSPQMPAKGRRGADMLTPWNGMSLKKMGPKQTGWNPVSLRGPLASQTVLHKTLCPPGCGVSAAQVAKNISVHI